MGTSWQILNSAEEGNKQPPPAQVAVLPWNFMATRSDNLILNIP